LPSTHPEQPQFRHKTQVSHQNQSVILSEAEGPAFPPLTQNKTQRRHKLTTPPPAAPSAAPPGFVSLPLRFHPAWAASQPHPTTTSCAQCSPISPSSHLPSQSVAWLPLPAPALLPPASVCLHSVSEPWFPVAASPPLYSFALRAPLLPLPAVVVSIAPSRETKGKRRHRHPFPPSVFLNPDYQLARFTMPQTMQILHYYVIYTLHTTSYHKLTHPKATTIRKHQLPPTCFSPALIRPLPCLRPCTPHHPQYKVSS